MDLRRGLAQRKNCHRSRAGRITFCNHRGQGGSPADTNAGRSRGEGPRRLGEGVRHQMTLDVGSRHPRSSYIGSCPRATTEREIRNPQ